MSDKFIDLQKKLAAIIAAVMTLLAFLGDARGYEMIPVDADGLLLNFAVISDIHLTDGTARSTYVKSGLRDIKNSSVPVDALVVAGDLTDDGEQASFDMLFKTLRESNTALNTVLATGNHDTWGDSGFEASRAAFISGYNDYTGSDIDNLYYYKVINGYYFIVLGTEDQIGCPAYLSQTQLDWLDATLAAATADGNPAFVICHQPLNDSHGLPDVWVDGGVGEQSDALEAILKSHKNVFFISGHLHSGEGEYVTQLVNGYKSIESDGSFHSVNLPTYSKLNARGNIQGGMGFQFEVYETRVVVRGRSYATSAWYPQYEYAFEIEN